MHSIINSNKSGIWGWMVLALIALAGCKKFIEVDAPTDKITEANVFNSDITAVAVLTGLYSNISEDGLWTTSTFSPNLLTFSKLGALSSDELDIWSGTSDLEKAYYQNALQTSYTGTVGAIGGEEMWSRCYTYIYSCNQAIKGISASNNLSAFVKQQLLGEAKFMRAFLYFYLVNLYGDACITTGTDAEVNRLLQRSPKSEVYELIIADLQEAKSVLSSDYLGSDMKPSEERVRPTKWAAAALLARAYLYIADYAKAEVEATSVIDQSALFSVTQVPLNNVFLKNSNESIWQLQPVTAGWNTMDAQWFALNNDPIGFSEIKSVFISPSLYEAFEAGDDRKNIWISSYISSPDTFYFPFKYKAGQDPNIIAENPGTISEYHTVLRLAEQYLIRAEARARLGNVGDAIADLNVIRTRARAVPTVSVPEPLPDLSNSLTPEETINAVLREKRVELFTEWGHRWLDLKRTGNIDTIMSTITPLKGGTWETTDQYYPLPASDLRLNPSLVQNDGYQY